MAEHPHHHHHPSPAATLQRAALLTIGFALIEAIGGWWTGSLALLSDAGHMLTDGAALAIGAGAAWIARGPPSGPPSSGWGGAEVPAAGVSGALMRAMAAAVALGASLRFDRPVEVGGAPAALIALCGLALNLAVLRWLSPHAHDLNARA